MALSGLHSEIGSLSREEEEANLRTMRTINSFEDVYKTYKHETQCFSPLTIPIDKNKSNTSLTTLKNHVDAYRPSTSTLIAQKVRDKIQELRHQHPEPNDRGSLPKNQYDHIDVNCPRFRIASGQIIYKGNGSCNYCDFHQTEYPDYPVDSCNGESLHQPMSSYPANYMENYGVDNCNCESLHQPMSSYPATFMANYDQCPGQPFLKYCKNETPLTPPNQQKSNHRQKIDFCCCSYGSNESMRDFEQDKALNKATVPTIQSNMDSKDSQSTSSEACCCCDRIQQNPSRSENRCYTDRGLIMPDGINKSDCGTHSLCQDRVQCCVGGCMPTKQNTWSDDCSCSPIPSPTTSGCLPPFFLNGCCPATSSGCPSTSSSESCGCPPTSMDCCSCATNCLDIESFLRKFKQVAPNCLTQPSPPCLGMGSGPAAGMGSFSLNNITPANNACCCSGYVNDVLQTQTVYSMDYQPIGCRGNNFNHFSNSCSGAGCSIRSGCIRMGGAGMPMTDSCGSNRCYQHPECSGCPPAGANCGLCGDLCGGQSNGIYAVWDLCCGMDFQQCYPLSQLSPGYCCSIPTECYTPCNSNNGCPGSCNMGGTMPYSCDYHCDAPDTSCGNHRMYGCCSKATSCHLSQS